MATVEERLYVAIAGRHIEDALSLLRGHPEMNVNQSHEDDIWTPLNIASFTGNVEVVELLLSHPDINVNWKNKDGRTSFGFGCMNGEVAVVELLLKDPRVDITLEDNNGCSPLWWASRWGYCDIVEWFIASGRNLGDVKNKKGTWWDVEYTTLDIARENHMDEVMSLLERFINDPAQTRHEVRVKLGMLDELAAEVFALTVFLCDDLLQLKPASDVAAATTASASTTRFFSIAKDCPWSCR